MMKNVRSRRTNFLLTSLFILLCIFLLLYVLVFTWDKNAVLMTFGMTEIPKHVQSVVSSRFNPLFTTRNDSELLRCFGEDSGDKYLITWYNAPPWTKGEMDYLARCPHKNCAIAYDRKCMRFSDAVMFRAANVGRPPLKIPGQIWVFQSFESPQSLDAKFSKWNGLFNWTLTYRQDASIPCRWGHYIRRENINIDLKSIYRNKTKSVLWLVSHCKTPSRREEYVKILQKYIDVDIYGKCGQLQCNGGKLHDDPDSCYGMFNKYKFYLSFENTLCEDYATEKAYKPLGKSTVPVVRGSSNYSSLLPPKSFINTDDFKSIKALGKYLNAVGNNETLYVKYLEWKRDYYMKVVSPRMGKICNVCEMLNDKEKYAYVYEDFEKWWWKNGKACHKVKDLTFK
ncbi:hypothetical protein CHS0354_009086 [Potamilus streckersoni]|uniref:Fucosyltransferase n=1 Tax=Potamilus streckersoni TaxID=2493646 RepID=A0AAE0TII8_9BIVA|nr:hypothetical protein CHS0354_009086 [Potamilus streckersoni]